MALPASLHKLTDQTDQNSCVMRKHQGSGKNVLGKEMCIKTRGGTSFCVPKGSPGIKKMSKFLLKNLSLNNEGSFFLIKEKAHNVN